MMISVTVMAMKTATEQKLFVSGDEDSASDEDKHSDGFQRGCERFRRGCEKCAFVLERNENSWRETNTIFVLERNQMGFCLI